MNDHDVEQIPRAQQSPPRPQAREELTWDTATKAALAFFVLSALAAVGMVAYSFV